MFSAVIRYLYYLRDLLFLPGVNHCQRDKGSKVVKVKSPKAIPEPFSSSSWDWKMPEMSPLQGI